MARRVAILVKGYPRLSETFIAQEILALERLGLPLEIVSLRHPTDGRVHALHRQIRASVRYLPEYLYQEPLRVLRAFGRLVSSGRFWRLLAVWLGDLRRDPSANRGRRLGQAVVLAAELPAEVEWLHVHYLHTPASVARYTAILRDLPFSISAHAKDVWTIPAWEKAEKIAAARWLVTCSRMNLDHLRALAPQADLELIYHGLEAERFPAGPREPGGDGLDPQRPVTILSVARAVEKKGLDVLLEALARLPTELHWRFEHIGGGPLARTLAGRGRAPGHRRPRHLARPGHAGRGRGSIASRRPVLPGCPHRRRRRPGRPAQRDHGGDVAGIARGRDRGRCHPGGRGARGTGRLVPPDDPMALGLAIEGLIRDPDLRLTLGRMGRRRILDRFAFEQGIERLARRFGLTAAQREAA